MKLLSLNLNKKIDDLFYLNAVDILATLVLLRTGLFVEKNPLMVNIVNNPTLATFIKIVIVGLLLLYLKLRCRHATKIQLKIVNKVLNIAIIIYSLIAILHIFNTIFLIVNII